jgi:hypothetical protein
LARFVSCTLVVLLLCAQAAHAITLDEIPRETRNRLPQFLLYLVPPQALAALTLADLEEYAEAYERGEFHFVAECDVIQHSGPLDPQLAKLILQVPQGAPYIEERFVRLAKQAYGRGIFSYLEWAVFENSDGSVDIQLYYASSDPQVWIPEPSYSAVGGWLAGVRYQDFYYGGEDKQLTYGLNIAEEALEDPGIHGSFTDNTINGGKNSYSISASVLNDWRRRLNGTPAVADLRQRTLRADGSYSWRTANVLGLPTESVTLGAGLYNQQHIVYFGDPTAEGTAPRSDFSQTGTAGYVSLGWGSASRNSTFTPTEGYSYSARLEQHVGDFPFTEFSVDLRKYIPAPNILGHGVEPVKGFGNRNNIVHQFPAASFALQAQASLADGDVPYSQEVRLGNSNILRGYSYDYYTGTKLLAARAEYRFALDSARANEAFVFTDHAWLGEDESDLESFDTWGVGGLFRLPFYGGFKVGAYMGWTFDGGEDSYGLAFGYQF